MLYECDDNDNDSTRVPDDTDLVDVDIDSFDYIIDDVDDN
jgi:hypothetical protein